MKTPIDQLRAARNAYLRDYNDDVIKYAAMGQPLPESISTYLQELRDLPSTANVVADDNGDLDESQITWPTKPEVIT